MLTPTVRGSLRIEGAHERFQQPATGKASKAMSALQVAGAMSPTLFFTKQFGPVLEGLEYLRLGHRRPERWQLKLFLASERVPQLQQRARGWCPRQQEGVPCGDHTYA